MIICKQCGAPMGDNAISCGKCGAENTERVGLDKQDLLAKLGRFKQLLDESSELAPKIRPQFEFPTSSSCNFAKKSFMRYFWPYMVGAVVTVNVLYFLGYILYISLDTPLLFSLLSAIGVIAMIVILIVGGKTAVKRRNELNIQVDNRNQSERKKYREIQEKTELLKTQYANKKNSLSIYNDIVPLKNRNSRHMIRVKSLLQTNKAETFADALKLITD